MKLRKVLAAVLAGTMVMASLTAVSAESFDDASISDAFSVHTGEVTLSGDFDITYTFNNVGDRSNAGYNYNNYIVEMHTAEAISTTSEGNYVFLDVRADNYGWWAYAAEGTEDIQFTATDVPADDAAWAAWLEEMKAGADVEVNIVRSGNTVTVTETAAGYTFVAVATTTDFDGQDLVVYLTGEQCKLTNVELTYNSGSDSSSDDTASDDTASDDSSDDAAAEETTTETTTTSDDSSSTTESTTQTGDAAPIAAVAVALLGCAAIAFASKKRFA